MVAAPSTFYANCLSTNFDTTKMAEKSDLDRGCIRQFEGLFATLPASVSKVVPFYTILHVRKCKTYESITSKWFGEMRPCFWLNLCIFM